MIKIKIRSSQFNKDMPGSRLEKPAHGVCRRKRQGRRCPMKGRILRMGLILVPLFLATSCFRPTEPDFWTQPCPNLSERLDPTQAERLEKLPAIPADTPVGIGNFIARVSSLRWVYEYFDSYTGKPVRSECPWLSYEWEFQRTTTEQARINLILLSGSNPARLWIRLYLTIGAFRGATRAEPCETWDPDPNRNGEVGEGMRCRLLSHVRPEWGPRWLVIFVIRTGGSILVPIPITDEEPVARVEIPPLPSR